MPTKQTSIAEAVLTTYGLINKHPTSPLKPGIISYRFQLNMLPQVYGTLEIHLTQNYFILEKSEFPLILYTYEQVLFLEKALAGSFFLDLKWHKDYLSITFKAITETLEELIKLVLMVSDILQSLLNTKRGLKYDQYRVDR